MWAGDGSLSYGGVIVVAIFVGFAVVWLLSSAAHGAYYRQTAREWHPDDARHVGKLPPILLIVLIVLIALGFTQPGAFTVFGGN